MPGQDLPGVAGGAGYQVLGGNEKRTLQKNPSRITTCFFKEFREVDCAGAGIIIAVKKVVRHALWRRS